MSKIKIGTIVKAVGLKGECRIITFTDFMEERFKKGKTIIFADGSQHTVLSARFKNNTATVLFHDINSVEEASHYVSQDCYIEVNAQHELSEDEYYFRDLKGCKVYQKDHYVGEVIEVIEQPAQTILRIKTDSSEFLLPFVKAFVTEVDISEKRIDVSLIEGFI